MKAVHHRYRRDFTMKTKLSGKVLFTYSNKKKPSKRPHKQWAFISDILNTHYKDNQANEVIVTTEGEMQLSYYIKQQTNVRSTSHEEEEDEPLDHTKFWAEVANCVEGAQDDDRTQGGDRRGLDEEVRAASGSVYKGAQQHANPMFESQDSME